MTTARSSPIVEIVKKISNDNVLQYFQAKQPYSVINIIKIFVLLKCRKIKDIYVARGRELQWTCTDGTLSGMCPV